MVRIAVIPVETTPPQQIAPPAGPARGMIQINVAPVVIAFAASAAGSAGCFAAEIVLNSGPLLSSHGIGGERRLVAAGSWTAAHAGELEQMVDAVVADAGTQRVATVDTRAIREIDTFGAWLLERLARELALDVHGSLPDRYRGLLDKVRHTNRRAASGSRRRNPLLAELETVGRKIAALGQDLAALLAMLGALGEAVGRVLVRPSRLRLTSTVNQLDRVAWQAVPIILLITFLIGSIIAQQGFFHFRKFGADDYVVDLVGILILREIGVLLVAIMVAGRSGSSYTAELGSMKMREEIDALRTMGRDPIEVLVLPRVLALVAGLPILTFLGALAALYGGGVVAWLYAGMSPAIYLARLQEAISVTHFQVGMIKAPFMALVIGAVACSEGMKVKGSAESLGRQTTTSVVKSIFLVIVLDGAFAIFFAAIGM
jgi:phospholipid/cholesterol/gamma-HCH transport system permease protein